MKKILLFLVLVNPFASPGQTPLPSMISLMPDSVWNDAATIGWEPDGTCFYEYNGFVYVFVFHNTGGMSNRSSYAYLYFFNKDHRNEPLKPYVYKQGPDSINYIQFGYPSEDVAVNDPWILGQTFAFEFNQRLWYFQHVHSAEDFCLSTHSFECFAQMPISSTDTLFHYYDYHEKVPDLIKIGAFQMDSLLWFISRGTSGGSTGWFLQKYIFQPTSNQFVFQTNYFIPNLINDTRLGGYFKTLDSLGNEYVILNTYKPYIEGSSSSTVNIGKLVPTRSSGTIMGFNYTVFTPLNYPFFGLTPNASTIIKGSVKGAGRTTDSSPANNDRFVNFYIGGTKNSNGNYPLFFNECYIRSDGQIAILNNGPVNLPVAAGPDELTKYQGWSNDKVFNIKGFQELRPMDYSNQIAGLDGFQQYIWFLYPDKKKYFNGGAFKSDYWCLDNSKTVHSNDLTDTLSYKGIKSMWTLVGITDGAPPCAMDWEKWDSTSALFLHDPDPTELVLTMSNTTQTRITHSVEDQWSHGNNMNISIPVSGALYSISEQYRYSNAFKNTYSSGTQVTTTYSNPFALTPETQDYGYKIWSVPNLSRYSYQLYPWWDTHLIYPVPNSFQYLIRSNGNWIVPEPVLLSEAPFLVSDPNSDSLISWTVNHRPHFMEALQNGLTPILNPIWQDPFPGGTYSVEYSLENSTISNSTSSYSTEASLGFKVPEIFELSLTGSYDITYSTEIKTTTIFGEEVEVSLNTLKYKEWGVNLSHLCLSVYWFKNDGTPWWYFNDLNGQEPWYLAYLSTASQLKIEALTPQADELIHPEDLICSWQATEGAFSDYTLFISTSSHITPGNVVYKISTGVRTTVIPDGFTGTEGGKYFWAVMGETREGEMAWSLPRSFLIRGKENTEKISSGMTVNIFPNPGMDGQVGFSLIPVESGVVFLMLYGPDGKLILEKEYQTVAGDLLTGKLPSLSLRPGIYIARFRSSAETLMRKVIITGNL